MSNLVELKSIAPKPVWDGVSARVVEGEKITMSVVELDPESLVPEHQHDNEQVGMVVEGSVNFRIGDEAKRLGPGGTWRILGGTPHEVRAGARGAVVIEAFAPIRTDWQAIGDDPTRRPRWPA